MKKINEKLLSWASIMDEDTARQALLSSEMPFIQPHLALMPDAHLGKGATVGSVIPTYKAIMPAAVGVDIGCGMIAVRTQFTDADLPSDLGSLREGIEAAIPLSPGRYNAEITASAGARLDRLETDARSKDFAPDSYAGNWRNQLGSLGGGNHFIEVCLDEENRVWLFLHSGSRGIGNRVAQRWIKTAQELCAKWWIELPDRDLAYLPENTPEFWSYIRQMTWAQDFAWLNRVEMMDRLTEEVEKAVGAEIEATDIINCHHNYTQRERHFGRDVWVSRKGAIKAGEDDRGLIPGSMGTASYVVVGRGNPLSLNSSPHGAGRNFSRTRAREQFTLADLRERMKGIEWRESNDFIDEHPDAYKDIDVVMRDAADLVKVEHTLRQVLNVKGT